MIGLLGSLVGARGGRMLGNMVGGRTGGMIGGMLGGLVGSRQLGRLARSVGGGGGGLAGMAGGLLGGDDEDDGGGMIDVDDADAIDEEGARLLVRLMCNSAKSDGAVDHDEAELIASQLGDDVPADERAFLQNQLESPFVTAAEVAMDIPADLAAEAYAVSLLAIDVDTSAENEYLADLASALDLSGDDRAEIHAELGVDF